MKTGKRIYGKKNKNRKVKIILAIPVLLCSILFSGKVLAADAVVNVLVENRDLFHCNNIVSTFFRWLGWGVIKGLAFLAALCADLFDKVFTLLDFTEWGPVREYIGSFRPIFIGLVCLSLLVMGVLLIFNYEKKPKIMINICLAVLIVSSSTYLISTMNSFLATDLRNAVVTGNDEQEIQDIVYDMVGSSFYDLIYLDDHISGGLMNVTQDNRLIYDNLSEEDMDLIDINEIVKEDDVRSESENLVTHRIFYKKGDLDVKEIYNGIAWTDLLNEYYYRYSVEWIVAILGLCSLILVFFFLSYKVVRILYEIVIHQLIAYLYSANLNNSQKLLKILDSVKDSYITLILVMVCMKIYLLAFRFVNTLGWGQFVKCLVLLFIAFAVIDGPNIIQKLTGVDAGLSSGLGKVIAGTQLARMIGTSLPRGAGLKSLLAGSGNESSAGNVSTVSDGQKTNLNQNVAGASDESTQTPPESDGGNSSQSSMQQTDQSVQNEQQTRNEQQAQNDQQVQNDQSEMADQHENTYNDLADSQDVVQAVDQDEYVQQDLSGSPENQWKTEEGEKETTQAGGKDAAAKSEADSQASVPEGSGYEDGRDLKADGSEGAYSAADAKEYRDSIADDLNGKDPLTMEVNNGVENMKKMDADLQEEKREDQIRMPEHQEENTRSSVRLLQTEGTEEEKHRAGDVHVTLKKMPGRPPERGQVKITLEPFAESHKQKNPSGDEK